MPQRSPARYLAPASLAVCALAFLIVLVTNSPSKHELVEPAQESRPAKQHSKATKEQGKPASSTTSSEKRVYVVKSGDTPSAIASANGVSLEEIRKLNPDLDPQLLHPGMKIKLRP